MTTTLTERYVAATVKGLPPTAQDDVRAELEASIADAVEARVEQGEERTGAERAVLTELGDPAVLAAGYVDRPLHLIGPRHYLAWWRLLKLLLAIAPACAAIAVALGQTLAEAPVGTIISQAMIAGIGAIVHVCFWVTLVFVILERNGSDAAMRWDLDQLREPAPTGTGRADLVAAFLLLGLLAGAMVWDRFVGFVHLDGEALPLLNPALWPWWMAGAFALMALQLVIAVVLYRRRRWDTATAVANTVGAVLFMSWTLTLLGRGQLMNPAFLDAAFLANGVDHGVLRILAVLIAFGTVGISVWSVVDGWLKRRRDAER